MTEKKLSRIEIMALRVYDRQNILNNFAGKYNSVRRWVLVMCFGNRGVAHKACKRLISGGYVVGDMSSGELTEKGMEAIEKDELEMMEGLEPDSEDCWLESK